MDYQVEAIEKFLSEWRSVVFNSIMEEAVEWKAIKEDFDLAWKEMGADYTPSYHTVNENREQYSENFYNAYTAKWSFPISRKSRMEVIDFLSRNDQRAERTLNEFLDKQVKTKRKNFITRVESKVGKIIDADLSIGFDGNLNGLVEGSKGKAYVETVAAGGYNVQSYHYRVLVKPLKK